MAQPIPYNPVQPQQPQVEMVQPTEPLGNTALLPDGRWVNDYLLNVAQQRLQRDQLMYNRRKAEAEDAANKAAVDLTEAWDVDMPELEKRVEAWRNKISANPALLDPNKVGVGKHMAIMDEKDKIIRDAQMSKSARMRYNAWQDYVNKTPGWQNHKSAKDELERYRTSGLGRQWNDLTPPDLYNEVDLLNKVYTSDLEDDIATEYQLKGGGTNKIITKATNWQKLGERATSTANSPAALDDFEMHYLPIIQQTPQMPIPIYDFSKPPKHDANGRPVPATTKPIAQATVDEIIAWRLVANKYKRNISNELTSTESASSFGSGIKKDAKHIYRWELLDAVAAGDENTAEMLKALRIGGQPITKVYYKVGTSEDKLSTQDKIGENYKNLPVKKVVIEWKDNGRTQKREFDANNFKSVNAFINQVTDEDPIDYNDLRTVRELGTSQPQQPTSQEDNNNPLGLDL